MQGRIRTRLVLACVVLSLTCWYWYEGELVSSSFPLHRFRFLVAPTPPPPPPPPHKNLYFVKIHLTGSGSFHQVLLRFALSHPPTFLAFNNLFWSDLFPLKASEKVLYPAPTHPNFTGRYNMWVDHARFYPAAGASFMYNDTLYITQIRHPFTHAPAVYTKFQNDRQVSRLRTLDLPYADFMKNPSKYEPQARIKEHNLTYSISRNVMAAELGYAEPTQTNVSSDFQDYLRFLDKQFVHISILEHLPESLVLLKRKLHWELKDLLMVHIHKHKRPPIKHTEAYLQKHREWSALDYALYDYFLARHKREVTEQGPGFQEEVNVLKEITDNFTRFCHWSCDTFRGKQVSDVLTMREAMNYSMAIAETKFSKAFNVTYADCVMLRSQEQDIKAMVKYQMYPAVCTKQPPLATTLRFRCFRETYVLPGLPWKFFSEQLPKGCNRSDRNG